MMTHVSTPTWRFAEWCRRRMPPGSLLMGLAAVTGVVAGMLAWLLKLSVRWLSTLLTAGLNPAGPNWILVLLPVIGILLTGIFVRYILKDPIEHGTQRIIDALRERAYGMRRREMFGSLMGSFLTLGFGGSAGGEGPIAFTGAAVGSNIGRLMGVSRPMMRIMIGIGAGAGIAGIFKSPMGGVMFTLEVVGMPLTTWPVISLVVSCILASATCSVMSGTPLDMALVSLKPLDMSYLPAVIVLALVIGVYSLYYTGTCRLVHKFITALPGAWTRNVVSGLLLGLLLVFFPMLYGEGYGAMARLIEGDTGVITRCGFVGDGSSVWLLVVAAGIVLAKGFAKSATTSGGGVAGDFAPTLFAGCVAGFLFAQGCNLMLGTNLPVGTMAFIGMAGMMAGAVEAPLMAVFIVADMASAYTLLVPLVIVALGSYWTRWLVTAVFERRITPHSPPGGRLVKN